MSGVTGIAPIFAVRDLERAFAHYERMGFTRRAYGDGNQYGFVGRDGFELHLGVVPDERRTASAAYLFVDDADALAAAWRTAGVEIHGPEDTPWGRREGAILDPDGNTIRFGSPLTQARSVT